MKLLLENFKEWLAVRFWVAIAEQGTGGCIKLERESRDSRRSGCVFCAAMQWHLEGN